MQVAKEILTVLSQATLNGSALKIDLQLDRNLYTKTNKVIEAAGGVWNRKAKAHLFDGSAEEAIDNILLTGQVEKTLTAQKQFQYFQTPVELAKRLCTVAGVGAGMHVGEPQAGGGRIARVAAEMGARVTCYELQSDLAANLQAEGIYHAVHHTDFLSIQPSGELFDAIVANPPFALQADIKHTLHAMKFLKSGAPIVTVMSSGVTFRETKLAREFRALVDSTGGSIEDLPQGTFAESGTMVNTVIVTL
ncbi:Type I restriction-modification system methyltransferase subunit family protein [Pseudomonas veronii]|uniref:SAM-dependent methyltransferase n=1 Tax=Pseudomonas veronii TaxID=76761 RepID=UPI001772D616|nr:SAM-dependent methyltransferase [Pseudomonas veronii]CAD0264127.1 Type I restriction-modification system methyltransferase subunit family protein [Pseudomonas veronii]CAD0265104.1 Type I restriction-modification system methyltransferase subunit family protein [Pseudomonas veronii]